MVKVYEMDGTELPTVVDSNTNEKNEAKQGKYFESWFTLGFSILSFLVDTILDLFEGILSKHTGIDLQKNTFWQDYVRNGARAGIEELSFQFAR